MALHCRVDHWLEAAVAGIREVIGHPIGQHVIVGFGGGRDRQQVTARQWRQPTMQFVDDAEIGNQCAQLGGRAELQFGA